MAYLGRLESESSYHNLAVLDNDESDDECFSPFTDGIDQNNNDEESRNLTQQQEQQQQQQQQQQEPRIQPTLYSSVSAYRWRKDTYPLDDYARNSRILEERRRIKRMSSLEARYANTQSQSQQQQQQRQYRSATSDNATDSRCDVFEPLKSESDDCEMIHHTDASSIDGSVCGENSSRSPCDSSNDESDGEEEEEPDDCTQILRSTSSSSGFGLNSNNNNNNKKKTRLSQGKESRSVNFRIHSPRRARKAFRFSSNSSLVECRRHFPHDHSLQISSVRASSHCDCPNFLEYNQRLIDVGGRSNIHIKDINGKLDLYSRYFSDIFTTFLDSSWSWILFVTTLVYVGHWIIFGVLYWIFAFANDDYAKMYSGENLASAALNSSMDNVTAAAGNVSGPGDMCVSQVYDFVSAFLFSMESETTIGYGSRSITPVCPVAITCLTLQCIISGIFDTWVIGLCYARMARPNSRSKTIMFASKAVICKRDGKRCLLVRIANLRKSLLVGVSLRAKLISCRAAETIEKKAGLDVMLEHHNVTFQNADAAFLTAPIEYCHVIDKTSPLYGTRPDMFHRSESNYFEVVIILTGTLESTGLTMQTQTSYLSRDIYYGHRFVPVVSKRSDKGFYDVDFTHFNDTMPEPTAFQRRQNNAEKKRMIENRRGTVTTLVEETEDTQSASDDVFLSDVKLVTSDSWV